MRHVVERRLETAHGEQFACGLDDPLPIALRIFAQPSARFVNHLLEFSDVPNVSQ